MIGTDNTVAGGSTGEQRDMEGGKGCRGRGRGQQPNDLGFTSTKDTPPENGHVSDSSSVVYDEDDDYDYDGSERSQGTPYDAFDKHISELLAQRPDLIIEAVAEEGQGRDDLLPPLASPERMHEMEMDVEDEGRGRWATQDQGVQGQRGIPNIQMAPWPVWRSHPLTDKKELIQGKWKSASEMVFSRKNRKVPEGTFTFNSSVENSGSDSNMKMKCMPRLTPAPQSSQAWINPRHQQYLANEVINAITTAEGQSPATSPPVSKLLKYNRKKEIKK